MYITKTNKYCLKSVCLRVNSIYILTGKHTKYRGKEH